MKTVIPQIMHQRTIISILIEIFTFHSLFNFRQKIYVAQQNYQ